MNDEKKTLKAPCVTAHSIIPSQSDTDLLLPIVTELVLGANNAAAMRLLVPMESKER